MPWDTPPLIKIYEALGAVADGRVVIIDAATAHVYSSSRGKYYVVTHQVTERLIMCNDNGSYFKGYLGYPAIAVLFLLGTLPYDHTLAEKLTGIAWKDLNQQYKNDFDLTLDHIERQLPETGRKNLREFAELTLKLISEIGFSHLGAKIPPPEGY